MRPNRRQKAVPGRGVERGGEPDGGEGRPHTRDVARPDAASAVAGTAGTEQMSLRQLLREAADWPALARTPYGVKPTILFVLLIFAASFDGSIFSLVLPDVIRDLELNPVTLLQVLNAAAIVIVLLSLLVAIGADRWRRVPMVAGGSIISGIFSLVTARSNVEWTVGASRLADGAGSRLVSVPAGPLLADYYPVHMRGKAFAALGVMGRAAGLLAPLAIAYLVAATSWRTPFLITGPVMILVGLIVLGFMREPVRGYMERRALGASEEVARTPEQPVSFGEAWRTTWSIRTIRRLFVGSVPLALGDHLFGLFFSIFLFQHYGLDVVQRGWMSAVIALAVLPGGFISGGLVDVLIRRRPQRVLVLTGILGVVSSLFLFVIASVPPLPVLVGGLVAFGFVGALLGPAQRVLYLQIVPPHTRALGSAVFDLADLPALLLRGLVIGAVLPIWGVQGAMMVAVPFTLIGALIQLSAAGLFEGDLRSSVHAAMASEEARRARDSGRSKLLVCRGVDVSYDGVQVLFGVDLDVEKGEIVALLGTNGAGKSTLLKAMSGTQEASSGAVVFDGRNITHMPPHEIAAHGVIHMPGGRGVFPDLTVRENLLLATWLLGEKEAKDRMGEVLEIFPVLAERATVRASVLSGGEQQMLSLAQAFLSKPRLLLIDELSLGLAPQVVAQLVEIVRRIHERGVTVIVVEQSVNVALTLAQRAVFMEKGEVRFFGPTAELLRRPDILRAVHVKGASAVAATGTPAGGKSERAAQRDRLTTARVQLEAVDLSKSYGGIAAVDGVSFTLREGEALGLIGPNGAGKTTLFELVSGYQLPDGGSILLEGTDISRMGADQRARMGLVRRFQDARLFPSLSVYENILVALERSLEVRSTVVTALQLPQARSSERRARRRADRLIELLELGSYRDKFVKELSTGLRRITDLACVLASDPKVLLLDEPSTGIAQAEAESLAPLLRRVRVETGCSMLVIEHDMPLISAVSDELIALMQGRVVTRARPDDVLNDPAVVESYLGTSEQAIKRSGVVE